MSTASTTKSDPARTPMLSLDEAVVRLLAQARARPITGSQTLSTIDALGRVLAADVVSTLDVPPADNTSMDGYALRACDVPAPGSVLPVSQRIAAGVVGQPLAAGTAARIFTGAQIPANADAVVMQEQCTALSGPGLGTVQVNTTVGAGQWIRRRGEDVQRGQRVLASGARLTAQAIGLAASVGSASLTVRPRPRVALFSTGDELTMPGEALKPGAIYNSNRFTLRGLLQSAGCEVIDLGFVPDRLDATRNALRSAASASDLVLTCGGVSVGEEDHLKPALLAEGQLDLWQIAIKPGKPLAFGAVRRPDPGAGALTHYLGLPGNPVSCFVTFLLAVAPMLRALQGMTAVMPAARAARADFDWLRPDRRREFLRVRFNADGGLDLFPNQSSAVLTSVVWADGLADVAPGQAIARGDTVPLFSIAELIGL